MSQPRLLTSLMLGRGQWSGNRDGMLEMNRTRDIREPSKVINFKSLCAFGGCAEVAHRLLILLFSLTLSFPISTP